MYSLGATLCEVIWAQCPFFHIPDMREVQTLLIKRQICLADSLPKDLGGEWQPFLEEVASYVQPDPARRPTATQAIARLLAKYPERSAPVAV